MSWRRPDELPWEWDALDVGTGDWRRGCLYARDYPEAYQRVLWDSLPPGAWRLRVWEIAWREYVWLREGIR